MPITVQRIRRLEVWTNWVSLGGTRVAVLSDAFNRVVTSNVDGSDKFTFDLPLESVNASLVKTGAYLRTDQDDTTFDEWRVTGDPTADDTGLISVTAAPFGVTALATCPIVTQTLSDGTVTADFESIGLSPSDQITNVVLPILAANGLTNVALGTITPTAPINLVMAWDSPRAVLLRIADTLELDLRRNGTSGYLIDIVPAINASAPIADIRSQKNLLRLVRNRSDQGQANRVYPKGAAQDGISATMAQAVWLVTLVSTAGGFTTLTLADPAGGDGPIAFDDQLNHAYVEHHGGSLSAVSDTLFATQQVVIPSSAASAAGDLIRFVADVTGTDLPYLESPADITAAGGVVISGTVDQSDVPGHRNYVLNPSMRAWPGTLPTSWSAVGSPTTSKQTAAPYVENALPSIKVTTSADGVGITTAAIPIFPTADNPDFSGFGRIWVASGSVRTEPVFTTSSGTQVVPAPPNVASNSVLGQFDSLGVSGIDANAIGATAVALRIVQNGTTASVFYIASAQITQSGAQLAYVEGSGGTKLWQAANEALRTNGGNTISYEALLVDLANLDPVTWGADSAISVGGPVRITNARMGSAITTRIIELTRKYDIPGDGTITLSSKPDDLSGTLARRNRPSRFDPSVTQPTTGPLVYNQCVAQVTSSNATTITIQVTASSQLGTPTVQLVAITGSATLASGPAIGTPSASGTTWVLNRGAALGGSGEAQFRAIFPGAISDDDLVAIPEQGRDTTYLVSRARVTATTATTVTVRYAVADPYPQGTNSATIGYQDQGSGGVTPATGQTVTPASTLTEAANTYKDFVITRPAFATGTARVTFTATAANRVSDSDAVDVPAQEKTSFGPNLVVTVTPGPTSYTITWSGDGVLVSIDGGAYGTPPSSPFIRSRNAPGGADQIYAFTGLKDSQTTSNVVVIPAQSGSTAPSSTITPNIVSDQLTPAQTPVHILASLSNAPAAYTYSVYKSPTRNDLSGSPVATGSQSSNPIHTSGRTITLTLVPNGQMWYTLVVTVGSDVYKADTAINPTLPGVASDGTVTGLTRVVGGTNISADALAGAIGTDSASVIANGGGQDGATAPTQATGWTFGTGQTLGCTGAIAKIGDRSLHIDHGGTPQQSNSYQAFSVTSGEVWEAAGWINTTADTGTGRGAWLELAVPGGSFDFSVMDHTGAMLTLHGYDQGVGVLGTGSATGWQYVRMVFTPFGSGTMRLYLTLGLGNNCWGDGNWDGVVLTRKAPTIPTGGYRGAQALNSSNRLNNQSRMPMVSTGNVRGRQTDGSGGTFANGPFGSLSYSSPYYSVAVLDHYFTMGGVTVHYESGTVPSMSASTQYWIIADDPNFLGDARSDTGYYGYYNRDTAVGNDAYYLVGSVTTGTGGSGSTGGGGGSCFEGDTLVTMADGSTRPILALRVGDRVLAIDERTRLPVDGRVTHVHAHDVNEVLVIETTQGRVVTTVEHPFLLQGGSFEPAGTFFVGTELHDGAIVTAIKIEKREAKVYNLTVEKWHTYYANGFAVHNTKIPPT